MLGARKFGLLLIYVLLSSCGLMSSSFANDAASQWRPVATPYGVAADREPLLSLRSPQFHDLTSPAKRILVVAHPSLSAGYFEQAATAGFAAALQQRSCAIWLVSASDGLADEKTSALPNPIDAKAYSGDSIATQYLWRSIGLLAPDVVVVVKPGDELRWELQPEETSFAGALRSRSVAGIGAVAAIECNVPPGVALIDLIDNGLKQSVPAVQESAKEELLRRQKRTPLQVADQLSRHYGKALDSVNYQQALALIGRLQRADLTGDPAELAAIERIAEPYLNGTKPALPANASGGVFAGHLLFAELATRTDKPGYIDLVRAVADRGFDANGEMLDAMPTHSEMSDAVFMGTPILVAAGQLTNDTRYDQMAIRHLRFMLRLNLRDDGLHRHSPLDPGATAWGRGNGFPALGLALSLSSIEQDGPIRDEMLAAYRAHLAAMIKHQDSTGMWHQVVDRPESYPEFTVTCMTTMAIARGLRRGWLDSATYAPVVKRAWPAIQSRIGSNGELIDVCTGTGKQKSLHAYYDRTAIRGRDARGGAMAMLAATEIGLAEREGKLKVE
ncbi:glycoside hydrolase family 88 protein [Rosistilla oblonga]|uniref:glycoside hydrolase family 88 protein n=1 Tax=Rosistilla oblonga TaxID=2527990 RepID=UPI003A96F58C